MKVMVTGGAGFIGSHVVDHLLQSGHQVTVVDDLSTGAVENLAPQAEFVRLSVLAPQFLELFHRQRFDAVLHLAAQTIVASSLAHPDVDARVNVLGTLQVLEGCRQSGVGRIIFASTAAVYGDVRQLPVTEDTELRPASFYGLSKLTAENYIRMYHELYGLHYMILRYANVYGERQGDRGEGGVVSIFCRSMQQSQPIQIFGDGEQTRDFIYVGDVAEANVLAVSSPDCDRVLNVSSSTETSVNQLTALLGEISGHHCAVEYKPARSGEILRSRLCNQAAGLNLAWRPTHSLAAGLQKTYWGSKMNGYRGGK